MFSRQCTLTDDNHLQLDPIIRRIAIKYCKKMMIKFIMIPTEFALTQPIAAINAFDGALKVLVSEEAYEIMQQIRKLYERAKGTHTRLIFVIIIFQMKE